MITSWRSQILSGTLLSLSIFLPSSARAQKAPPAAPAVPPSAAIVIPDEPRGVDPATLLPAKLAAPVKIEFNETSLGDVVKWLQTEQKLGVVLDQVPLTKEGILISEPVTDQLENLPLHLLLDRLRSIGVGWYLEDGLVHLTTLAEADNKLRTTPYNVGDLVNAGYKPERLLETITSTIAPPAWDFAGGAGSIVELGDVLFVSQSHENHLQIAGLLQALRKHGRRTYTYDEPGHEKVRAALERPVKLDLHDVPFSAAVEQLAKQAAIKIRLDRASLQQAKTRERQPVSLAMADQKLRVVLRVLLDKLELTWVLRDGALWITSTDDGSAYVKTAVYDVRDLCRDEKEAEALQDAIENQMQGVWEAQGGAGAMEFPLPGTMVVAQTEQLHNRLLELLESYRTALRISKPRPRPGSDGKEIITRYYRLPSAMANDLAVALPKLLKEETWKTEARPDAPGTILVLTSRAKLEAAAVIDPMKGPESKAGNTVLIPYSVLVIKQTREVHSELPDLLRKIEEGDFPPSGIGGGLGGGMGGMGGFGGGFMSVPSR